MASQATWSCVRVINESMITKQANRLQRHADTRFLKCSVVTSRWSDSTEGECSRLRCKFGRTRLLEGSSERVPSLAQMNNGIEASGTPTLFLGPLYPATHRRRLSGARRPSWARPALPCARLTGEEGKDREPDGFFLSNTPAGAAHVTHVSNNPMRDEDHLLGVDVREGRGRCAPTPCLSPSVICSPQQEAVSSLLVHTRKDGRLRAAPSRSSRGRLGLDLIDFCLESPFHKHPLQSRGSSLIGIIVTFIYLSIIYQSIYLSSIYLFVFLT